MRLELDLKDRHGNGFLSRRRVILVPLSVLIVEDEGVGVEEGRAVGPQLS